MRIKGIFFYVVIFVFLNICGVAFTKNINGFLIPKEVSRYKLCKIELTLPYFEGNIRDSAEVMVEAKITSPRARRFDTPAFCVSNEKSKEKSLWEIRFTPLERGRYRFYVEVKAASYKKKSSFYNIDVKDAQGDGFLRQSGKNSHFLVFDSGKPFFGIGHNVAWVYNDSISVFDRYFALLAENHCNLTRIWLTSWSFPLEWKTLGKYDQDVCSKLDELFETAAKRNIYILFCLDTYGSFMEEEGCWGEDKWGINPYNKRNGGPCEKPEDFFTNETAKRFYKNKLRYIVSRWGYSPNILAFELWNEYNVPCEWLKEMAAYVKSLNAHGQLVTTSVGLPYSDEYDESLIWKLKEIDLVTVHAYADAAENGAEQMLWRKSRELSEKYKKPFIISEFGINFARDDKNYDPEGQGTALHNSIWISAMSKSFGTVMNWWWEQYVRVKDLYPHYRALEKFFHGINWNSEKVEYARTCPIMTKKIGTKSESFRNAVINTRNKWGKIKNNEFLILKNGNLEGEGVPVKYLHGVSKEDMRDSHKFNVDYPCDGKFIIRVGTVSQDAEMRVFVDDKEKFKKVFPTGPGQGPWKKSIYLKNYDIYQCVYDTDVEIDIPKGRHTIVLSNTGEDWLGIEKITLTNYIEDSYANVMCAGIVIGEDILLWIQNRDFNWENTFNKVLCGIIKDVYFDVSVSKDGIYHIEWWDTFKGEVIFQEKKEAQWKKLRVNVPDFSKDIACKIRKQNFFNLR